ncbi:MAG: BsuPI-related putative proteinase inhibitor [Methylacidiphilales bacterium]|nr:BsuPI-related putative proteinase inhibitor [Candidatus Methylacidiphilales bacterium]MDW8349613.1 BsuPI-related putative proteinase inhibitor [Verrucomicrobiae bacterium]
MKLFFIPLISLLINAATISAIEVSPSKKTVPEKFRNPNPKKLRMSGDVNRIHRANEIPYKQIVPTLNIEKLGQHRVKLTFSVTNKSRRVITLPFSTARRYEIRVRNSSGKTIFNSSAGKLYAQVLGTLAINPNDSATYEETISLPPGEYVAEGELVEHEVLNTQKAFSVP